LRFQVRGIMSTKPQPDREKTVSQRRADFKADLYRDVASTDYAACLSADEILALQSGLDVDPGALDHLDRCEVCGTLRRAVEVDSARLQQFMDRARESRLAAPQTAKLTPAPLDWRAAATAFTFIASAAMVLVAVPTLRTPGKQGPNPIVLADQPVHFDIAVNPESANKENQVTVKDYAQQIATALVLAKSKISVPPNSSVQEAAEASTKAHDIIHQWVVTGEQPSSAEGIQAFKDDTGSQSYELMLPGKVVARVPHKAWIDGMSTKDEVLHYDGAKVNLNQPQTLKDGSTFTLTVKGGA